MLCSLSQGGKCVDEVETRIEPPVPPDQLNYSSKVAWTSVEHVLCWLPEVCVLVVTESEELCLMWSLSQTMLLRPSWFNSCLAVVVLISTFIRSPASPMASFIFLSQGPGQIPANLPLLCICPRIAGAAILTAYPNPSLLRGNNNSHSVAFLAFIVTSKDKCKLISRIIILFEEQRIVRGGIFLCGFT